MPSTFIDCGAPSPRRLRRFVSIVLILLACAVATGRAQAPDYGVRMHQLKNGMRILVQEDHSIPNVALYVFYRIGSRNERPGTTGLSHFFEHMMFNGAKKYGPKQFDETMEAAGGSNNAYTSNDVTAYQDWFPRSALETIFDLEADRIQNLNFDEKMIESERQVVASERRTSVDNSNLGILEEQLNAAAFTAHPYQWPVVGWMVDIESWTMEDLKRHFDVGYSPANATMVIVGDVTFDEIVKLAQKYVEPDSFARPASESHNPRTRTTGRAPRNGAQVRAIADRYDGLSRTGIGQCRLLSASSAQDYSFRWPEFPNVPAPDRKRPARHLRSRRLFIHV